MPSLFTSSELPFAQYGAGKTKTKRSKSPKRAKSPAKRAKSPKRKAKKGGDMGLASTVGSLVFPHGITQTLTAAGLLGAATLVKTKKKGGSRSKSPSRRSPSPTRGGKRSKSPRRKTTRK